MILLELIILAVSQEHSQRANVVISSTIEAIAVRCVRRNLQRARLSFSFELTGARPNDERPTLAGLIISKLFLFVTVH